MAGASSGIGLATALAFARRGDRLVLAARDGASLDCLRWGRMAAFGALAAVPLLLLWTGRHGAAPQPRPLGLPF